MNSHAPNPCRSGSPLSSRPRAALAALGRFDEALANADKAIELSSDDDRVSMQNLKADILARAGEHRVHHLESQLQDAQMARLMGEQAGNPAEIQPELERSRGSLESQLELIERVKDNRKQARMQHALLRMKERREERERQGAE